MYSGASTSSRSGCTGSNHLSYRRIERQIINLARQRGFDGDPYAEHLPHIGNLDREFAAEDIVLAAGVFANQPKLKSFARRLARSIVLTSSWVSTSAPPKTKRRRRGA